MILTPTFYFSFQQNIFVVRQQQIDIMHNNPLEGTEATTILFKLKNKME